MQEWVRKRNIEEFREFLAKTTDQRQRRILLRLLAEEVASGPGLAPDVVQHLFQLFVATKRKGLDLGLFMCRTTAEAHGGKIRLEDRPGDGSVFRFTLRVAGFESMGHAG